MSSPLGPQCFTCRKRRVKCDSTEPVCQRCGKDDLQCLGYQRPLKIVPYRHPRRSLLGKEVISKKKAAPQCKRTGELAANDYSSTLSRRHIQPFLLESFQYFENFVIPKLIPAGHPFHREKIDRDAPWHMLPKVFLHFMIIWLRSLLPDERMLNWSSRQTILRHRGLGLVELRKLIGGAIDDPYGAALSCILLLMGTDMSLADETWISHLEAARGIIRQRGGLRKCFDDLPDSRALLIFYIITEVITSTTCNSTLLKDGAAADLLDLSLVPDIANRLIRIGCLCPLNVLLAIARVNELRMSPEPQPSTFQDIWESLEAFDASAWAHTLLNPSHGRILPERPEEKSPDALKSTFGLAALGSSFQNAAMLYLLLSCPQAPDSVVVTQTPRAIKRSLTSNCQLLSQNASQDEDGPVDAQLWRHNIWPQIISAYAWLGWGISSGIGGNDDANVELCDLEAAAAAIGSPLMANLAQHYRNLQCRRASQTSWTWDDGFSTRFPLFDR